jgi:2-polyprenyl-3-methyl-5-hydroxy-6-metoxy-1,4-benzoquinol methylase
MPTIKQAQDWTDADIKRFWEWYTQNQPIPYFGQFYAKPLVRLIHYFYPKLDGLVLDYGCGPGFVLEALLAKDLDCEGIDFSEASIQGVNNRFANLPHWHGGTVISKLPSPLASSRYDLVICTETVEHLREPVLHDTIAEIYRLTKPNGKEKWTP